MRNTLHLNWNGHPEQLQQRRQQIHPAEQFVVHVWLDPGVTWWPHDQGDARAGVVQRRLRPGQGRPVIGEEHHPGVAVQPTAFQRVQQLPHRRIGDRDGPVELRQVVPYRIGVGQVIGNGDGFAGGGFVAVPRVGPVGLEEPGGEQERFLWWFLEPPQGLLDDVLTVGVRDVVFVEAQPGREGRLVLHTEERCVPTGFGEQLRKRLHARVILPPVMRQPDQPVALRVAPREQRTARRRAQRSGGVRAGEQDAFGGQLVQPGTADVAVAVRPEVAPEVVPVHEQHVLARRVGHGSATSCESDDGTSHLTRFRLAGQGFYAGRFVHDFPRRPRKIVHKSRGVSARRRPAAPVRRPGPAGPPVRASASGAGPHPWGRG
ncbi:Uncharacterised protein [Mycobacteroides abscessus subsp. abscessus]|nr:Uncharacterised protein [Mycobacteroides abscessus subsp. abscessus]